MQIKVTGQTFNGARFRYGAGIAFDSTPKLLSVVDDPKPHQVVTPSIAMGAESGRERTIYSDEISFAQYAELQADSHLTIEITQCTLPHPESSESGVGTAVAHAHEH